MQLLGGSSADLLAFARAFSVPLPPPPAAPEPPARSAAAAAAAVAAAEAEAADALGQVAERTGCEAALAELLPLREALLALLAPSAGRNCAPPRDGRRGPARACDWAWRGETGTLLGRSSWG